MIVSKRVLMRALERRTDVGRALWDLAGVGNSRQLQMASRSRCPVSGFEAGPPDGSHLGRGRVGSDVAG